MFNFETTLSTLPLQLKILIRDCEKLRKNKVSADGQKHSMRYLNMRKNKHKNDTNSLGH